MPQINLGSFLILTLSVMVMLSALVFNSGVDV
uniref:ATPase subunit 8 n=1 Tax=Phallusia fumigata TaxID=395376 RepID=A7WL93_9ASCI|nr:ATP synthase F0 subunit 8 [Phallusia fumigata]CAL24361.1 ATPase subunit 8 [Phallusia fumigata]